MKPEPPTPVSGVTPDQMLERMKELTRRLIKVPKSDVAKPKRQKRRPQKG